MWDYTDKVKEHFLNQRNVGELENANAVGEVGSIACGDALKLMMKIEDGKIIDAKFKTFGCGSAIATASALTEMLKGMTVEEAEALTNKDIVEFLGGLPRQKMHCSVMGSEALAAAIADYRGVPLEEVEDQGEVVCVCFGVTDKEIERVVRQNKLKDVQDVTNFTKAGGACGACIPQIESILNKIWTEEPTEPVREKPRTFLEKIRQIERIIEEEIRPVLNHDGGDIELIDIQGNIVKVRLLKNCASCPVSEFTLNDFVGEKLREFVDENIVVEEVE